MVTGGWRPKTTDLQNTIEALKAETQSKPDWSLQPPAGWQPIGAPQDVNNQPVVQPFTLPQQLMTAPPQPAIAPKPKEEPISLPFWQRALQVFTAPFEWVDENIINQGLLLAGRRLGSSPKLQDYQVRTFGNGRKGLGLVGRLLGWI